VPDATGTGTGVPPAVPSRPANSLAAPGAEAEPLSPISNTANDDPYGQLADLDFGGGAGVGTGGGYETDMPRPRGADEDLLF
jgi:hypothetical protein